MLPHRRFFTHLFTPLSLSLFLVGCSQFDHSSSFSQNADVSSDYYLRQSLQATDEETQTNFKLLAVRALLAENKIAQAQGLLDTFSDLSPDQLDEKTLLQVALALALNQYEMGEQQLHTLNFSQLTVGQKVRFLQLNATLQVQKQDYLSAIKSLIEVDTFLNTPEQKQANNDEIWAILRNTPPEFIQDTLLYTQFDTDLQGWLSLAMAYNNQRQQPENLRQAMTAWRTGHVGHIADMYFPTSLKAIFHFQHFQPQHIALLLPLSGNLQLIGNTVKQGFEKNLANTTVKITPFDTSKMSMSEIMQQVKAQGADTVVGPLLKQNVEQLIAHPSWRSGLRVLALNANPQDPKQAQMCYYSLSPEDEAYASADKMWQQQITRPLVLVPQNAFGQRIASAFQSRWETLGGGELEVAYYNNMEDLRPILVRTLGIVETIKDPETGQPKPVEQELTPNFQPIQGVFALGNNQQLANIKTAIDNTEIPLPLFTTSRINSPNNQASYRLLMDKVKFTDLPLFQDRTTENYKQVLKSTKGDYSLMRLRAFGEDAGKIINNISELQNINDFTLLGLTGELSADERCHIQRKMAWFEYEKGTLHPITSVVNTQAPSTQKEVDEIQEDKATIEFPHPSL